MASTVVSLARTLADALHDRGEIIESANGVLDADRQANPEPVSMVGQQAGFILGNIIPANEVAGVMKFFDTLVRYEIGLWDAVDRELRRQGMVRLGVLHALRIIDQHAGQARVQDLSSDIGITVGAASKLADRVERDGLAARRPNPANRRSSLISLTPQGQAALTGATRVAAAAVGRAVGDEDLRPLLAALERLQARLDDEALDDAALDDEEAGA